MTGNKKSSFPVMIVLMALSQFIPGSRITKKRFKQLTDETTSFYRNAMQPADEFSVPVILTGGTGYRTRPGEVADESWPDDRSGITRTGEGLVQTICDIT
jgi:hypothetical protein